MSQARLPPNLQTLFTSALHKAFASLQEILSQPVTYHIPEISLLPLEAIPARLAHGIALDAPYIRVHQTFSGPLNGATVFALDIHQARKIVSLLTGTTRIRNLDILTPSEDDIIREIGGILCNALVGGLSNHLHLRLRFSLPRTSTHSLEDLLAHLPEHTQPSGRVLVAQIRLEVQQVNVQGQLLIVMDMETLERFLTAIDEAQS